MTVDAQLCNASVRLGHVQALDHVTLSVPRGSFVALLGPSGSGKTTTLNVFAGFVHPDEGSVLFDGADVTNTAPAKRDLGMVFQNYALFPHMTVGENIGFPLRMRRMSRATRTSRVRDALGLVGLAGYESRAVSTLSGGQRQRTALARAVVFEPAMMLLDEPLAALDKKLRESMQHELKHLQRRLGVTTIAVTHDQVEALTMADIVAVMNDGRVEQVSSPADLYLHPKTLFVATFLGEANILQFNDGALPGFGRIPGRASHGTAVVRPEHLSVVRAGAAGTPDGAISAQCRVEEVSFQGPRLRLTARLVDHPDVALTLIESSATVASASQVGDTIRVALDSRLLHVISADDRPDPDLAPALRGHDGSAA